MDTKMINRGGRPRKYQYEDLRKILIKYASENRMGKITMTNLVKYSNIPIQAWRFNEKIKNDIEYFNSMPLNGLSDMDEMLEIPSAEEIVNINYKNKERLTKVIADILELYNHSCKEAFRAKKLENENLILKDTIKDLQRQIEKIKKTADFYKEEVKRITVESTKQKGRTKNNLQDNIIDLKKRSEADTTFANLFRDI